MIYVSDSEEGLIKLDKKIQLTRFTDVEGTHPSKAEDIATELCKIVKENNIECVLYNTVVMDYIDLDLLVYVDNAGNTYSFKERFKEQLCIPLYPGEILLNINNK